MANRSLPMDTRPLAPERLLADDKRVLLNIAQTLAAIVKDSDDSERNPNNDTRTAPSQPPWAKTDIHRTPRVLLIDGARGTGKTSLMLTLVRACNEGNNNDYYDDERNDSAWAAPIHLAAVRAIQPLDFDPMPPGLPLLAWFVQSFRPLVKWASGSCGTADRRGLGEVERRTTSGQTLEDKWQRLHDDAAVAWQEPTGQSPYEGGEAQLKRIRKWSEFAEDWHRFIDSLITTLAEHNAWSPARRASCCSRSMT
jgi:hypothetical protein